ncbi:MAG: RNA polymerase factor sigma-54 [bacterium]|nr:RNA polymerase factor sigma-54 [bacterium]
MALETRLALRTTQRLVMTAMLQQAIKLLPLSRLELIQKIHQEMLENPFLDDTVEQEENTTEATEEESSHETEEEPRDDSDIDWDAYFQDSDGGLAAPVDRGREAPSLEATLRHETSLTEYLIWQLSLTVRDDLDKEIGAYLLGNFDDDGYLQCQVDEVAAVFEVGLERVEDVLYTIQAFDPAGVGARDLGECLLIQLRHLGMEDSLAGLIVQNHLPQIEERYFRKIARELNVDVDDVIAAVKVIRELDPKPGSRYTAHRVEYIVLDVVVVKTGEDYQVFLNDDGMPKLRINSLYQNILRRGDAMQGDTKDYLEDKFRSAVWLMKSIEQRRQTLLKVAKSICEFQRGFLDKGMPYLRPLVLKDVAEDIGMHESTVSRVTTNKYIHTPQGVFELKFFFHSGLDSFGGSAMSSVTVKDIIRKAVLAEDSHRPLTDQQLVGLLEDKGIKIARRTVAKYRQELRIAPANRRKRLF